MRLSMLRKVLHAVLVLCAVMCSSWVLAQSGLRELVIQKAAAPLTVDGKPDEACWQTARRVPLRHYAGGEISAAGEVALCYDDEHLYAAFWLDEPEADKIVAPAVAVNAPEMWSGEVVEWLIDPDSDQPGYIQLAWNPAGSRYNARFSGPSMRIRDDTWEPQWRTASVIGKSGWTSEAAFPFAALGQSAPVEGGLWAMNLCRDRLVGGVNKDWHSMVLTPTGFHTPERFLDVWFGTVAESAAGAVEHSATLRALVGCWSSRMGYDWMLTARRHLARALGSDNVDVRTCSAGDGSRAGPMAGWPRRYRGLAGYDIVLLANVPATAFTDAQVEDMVEYVRNGGRLVLAGRMHGDWKHKVAQSWDQSALGPLLPTAHPVLYPALGRGRIELIDPGSILFRDIPLDRHDAYSYSRADPLADGARMLASVSVPAKDGNVLVTPFLAEKRLGDGLVLQINMECAHLGGNIPVTELRKGIFPRSPFYPRFWDNLVEYLTGRAVPHPAVIEATAVAAAAPRLLDFDLIDANYGDVFRPGGTVRVRPLLGEGVTFPCRLDLTILGADGMSIPAGTHTLEAEARELTVQLAYLDRGEYKLHGVLRQGAEHVLAETTRRFAVVLPLVEEDEFGFSVFMCPDHREETETLRTARELREAGFTGVGWLGGVLVHSGYNGTHRLYREGRFASRMQEAGLRVTPVWYPVCYEPRYGLRPQGHKLPSGQRLPRPDWIYPGKQFLPWEHTWLRLFDEQVYGRMPLVTGYSVGDEMVARTIKWPERFTRAFERLTGSPAPTSIDQPEIYAFTSYQLEAAENSTWLARRISEAYHPGWEFESIISPMSLTGHSSAIVDPILQATSLGKTGPDVYWYMEGKLYLKTLHMLAINWSATEFGRLARFGLTAGQLGNNYYEEFPEQVFSAISAGASFINVFAYSCASFEKHAALDERAAAIRRRTTAEAGLIGRTLNHYRRERARVALLYPHSAYLHECLGKSFSADYLNLTGDSPQYLNLRYAFEAASHVLRRMTGHVDILFDRQIQRGDLRNYDVLAVACAKQVEQRTMREVTRFVEHGGMLLVSTDSARLDEFSQSSGVLYDTLPATVGAARSVPTDYSETRMSKPSEWSTGHALVPKDNAEVLFTFADQQAACVRGPVGRGEAIVLGMPLAGLNTKANRAKFELIEYIINRHAYLISKPDDSEFSAITFTPERGSGRVFMVFNGRKEEATTTVRAWSDAEDAKRTLVDIVTGKAVPFNVDTKGQLTFSVPCPGRWGRALALLRHLPAAVEVSVSGAPEPEKTFMIAARLLREDEQPVHATLPLRLTVTDPDGTVRDDLSGVRVAQNGVYVFSMTWPVNARTGTWTVTAQDTVSGTSDSATWDVR